MQAGEHRRARWNAYSIGAISPGKPDAFASQSIQMRRLNQPVPRTSHNAGFVLVAEKQQNVGSALTASGQIRAAARSRRLPWPRPQPKL